jgi:hypothetical protein
VTVGKLSQDVSRRLALAAKIAHRICRCKSGRQFHEENMFQAAVVAHHLARLCPSASEVDRKVSWRVVAMLAFLLIWGAPNTYAHREFEVDPFFGARYGAKIDLRQQGNPNADYLKIKNSENYGVVTDVTVWRNLQGEFIWNRQPTSLTTHNPNDGTNTFLSKIRLDSYLFGVTYQFRESERKVRPFAGLLFGFSHYGVPPINGQPVLNFTNRYAFNMAGGVKYFFNRNFGIRMETRWSPSDSTYKETDICDSMGILTPCKRYNSIHQWQANIGLIFRIK